MYKLPGLFVILLYTFMTNSIFCQIINQDSLISRFPQQQINFALNNAFQNQYLSPEQNTVANSENLKSGLTLNLIKFSGTLAFPEFEYFSRSTQIDTLFVGLVPNDTIIITGNYANNGPVYVFNDGVLIFQNATATIYGDIIIFQNGKMTADSSTFIFPQQYFYQRSIIVANNGTMQINNCTLNYGGLSHNLAVTDSANVEMNNVNNPDWTTAGMYGNCTFSLNGTNLAGEYILSGNANVSFKNANTLLLWHHFPDASVIDFSFPQGDSVYAYQFNNTLSGISGVNYGVSADSCYNVWWGLMPVNGSDVTISNSDLRTIGCWFERGDSVSVSGLINNSNYPNFTAPLPDRNLHLINTFVQTWSLYVFDTSHISVTSSIVGEIGCLGKSTAFTQSILLDGSGGYFWASDTTLVVAANTSVTSHVRSERNGIFILGYSSVVNGIVSATGQSVVIAVQSTLPQDPVAFDGAIAWMVNIAQPSSAWTNMTVTVSGNAWIDQGPNGSWMDFGKYSMWYQQTGSSSWTNIVADSSMEIHNGNLAFWNTIGLNAGSYNLRLVVYNNLGDSVEAVKQVTLLPGNVGIDESAISETAFAVYPNPAGNYFVLQIAHSGLNKNFEIRIYDLTGRIIFHSQPGILNLKPETVLIDISAIPPGFYVISADSGNGILKREKFEIVR